MKKRLQVVLSHSGIASRRKAVSIIEKGRVAVNGHIVRERGFSVDISEDEVLLDGKPLYFERKAYVILNKPKGVVTTLSDEKGRKTVMDLIPPMNMRLYPVGRLDKNTEGLILLTNDGELANRLTHPRYGVNKIYTAHVLGLIDDAAMKKMESGVYLEGKKTAPCRINVLKKSHDSMVLRIELHEGRKRQIRRMIASCGGKVKKLIRTNYADLTIKGLLPGEARPLSGSEIKRLKEVCLIAE